MPWSLGDSASTSGAWEITQLWPNIYNKTSEDLLMTTHSPRQHVLGSVDLPGTTTEWEGALLSVADGAFVDPTGVSH